jgi:hypothetical protein
MRRFLIILLLLVLTACNKGKSTTATTDTPTLPDKPAVGKPTAAVAWTGDAHDFGFKTFDGKSLKLSSYAGKPLVLNFWADW